MVPAPDSSDNLIRIGFPDEGLRLLIVLLDEAIDGGLEIDDGSKDTSLQSALCELGEEAFDGIEPGGGGWREVEGPPRMLRAVRVALGGRCGPRRTRSA